MRSERPVRLLTDKGDYRSYPSDYLFSRLRGRIEKGIDYIKMNSPETARRYVEEEHRWVYLQMDNRLRKMLWTYFFYREIRKISEWLRLGDVSSQLEFSLLSDEIKGIFLRYKEVSTRIERLEAILSRVSEGFRGMRDIFEKGGLKTLEESLLNSFISMAVSVRYPPLRRFFRYLLDFRNLTSLYKYLRWGIDKTPCFLSGGSIGEDELRDAYSSGDAFVVQRLSLRRLRIHIDNISELEIGLFRGLRDILKRENVIDPAKPTLILYYLWNLHLLFLSSGA